MNDVKTTALRTRSATARRFITIFALLLTAAIFTATFIPSGVFFAKDGEVDISDANMKKLEDQLKKLQADDAALKKKIADATKNITSERENKQYLDTQISITESKIETQNLLLIELGNEIHATQRDIENLIEEITEKREMVTDMLRMSYENGRVSYLEIVLDSSNFSDFLMNIERVGSMLDYQNKLLENLNQMTDDAKIKNDDLLLKSQLADELRKSLINDEADLEKQLKNSDSYLKVLNNTVKASEAQQIANEKARQEINAEVEKILVERQRQSNANYVGGDLAWPLDLKWKKISSGYGWRAFDNATHLGIDIPADYGEPVYAANGGTVVTSTYHYSYGNYVLIDHGGGKATLYAHNSKNLVKEGDKVKSGQKIAQVGSTGFSTGNHLHFEVRIDGKTVNPVDNEHLVVVPPK